VVGEVVSRDGLAVRYEVVGAGAPPLVLVHGWSCDRTYWRHQTAHFSRRATVVTVDLGGHGESGTGRVAWTVRSFGDDVVAVLDALDLRDAVLVGHSLGGQIVRQVAYRNPKAVAGLVLVDPAADQAFEAYAALDPEMPSRQRGAYAPALRCAELAEKGAVTPDTPEGRACIPPPPPEMPADLRHLHEDYARRPAHYRTTLAELDAGLNGTDEREAAAARHPLGAMPIVVLTADGNLDNPGFKPADRKQAGVLWLAWHEDMAHLSTRGEHRVVSHTSHYIQNDQPAAVSAAIEEVAKAAQARR